MKTFLITLRLPSSARARYHVNTRVSRPLIASKLLSFGIIVEAYTEVVPMPAAMGLREFVAYARSLAALNPAKVSS